MLILCSRLGFAVASCSCNGFLYTLLSPDVGSSCCCQRARLQKSPMYIHREASDNFRSGVGCSGAGAVAVVPVAVRQLEEQ